MPIFQSDERYKNMSKQAMYDEILELKERNAELKQDNAELKARLQGVAPPQPAAPALPAAPAAPVLPAAPAAPAYPDLRAENHDLVTESHRLTVELSTAQHRVAFLDTRIVSLTQRIEELTVSEQGAIDRADRAEGALPSKEREITGLKARIGSITNARDELEKDNAEMAKTITERESELRTKTRALENSEATRLQLTQDATSALEANRALVAKLRETIARLNQSNTSASDAAAEQLRRAEERLARERKELHNASEIKKRDADDKIQEATQKVGTLTGQLQKAHGALLALQQIHNTIAGIGLKKFEECMAQEEELRFKNTLLEQSIQALGKSIMEQLTVDEQHQLEASVTVLQHWRYELDRNSAEYRKAQTLFANVEECGFKNA